MSSSISTPTDPKKPALRDAHVEYLKKRAVPLEFALEAGLRSMPEPTPAIARALKAHFRSLPLPPVSGLLVPYKIDALDGIRRCRIRPDQEFYWKEDDGAPGGPAKKIEVPRWLAQKDVAVVPYFPPQIQSAFKDVATPLHIVEAPVKALSLTANGFPAIGLGGVEAGFADREEWKKHKHLSINKELARIDWRKRPAFVVYDAGIQNNPRVALGAAKLALVLKDAGANVHLAFLPLVVMNDVSIDEAMTYEGQDQGPDDFLGRHGKDGPAKLREIIDTAVPADPVDRAKLAMAKGNASKQEAVVALLADLTFVAALHIGGHVAVDQVAAIVSKSGIKRRTIQEAIKRLQDRLEDVGRNDEGGSDIPYVIDEGRIAMPGFKGETRYLADFNAAIVAEVVRDDGVSKKRVYRIEGTLPNGTKLPLVDVPADEFPEMKWTTTWGSKAIVRAGKDTRDHVRVAIQALSTPTTKNVFAHVGWREIDGKHVYLHPGGAVGAEGVAVEVDLGGGQFRLPDRIDDLAGAIRCSLSILDGGPLTVTLPALAAAYTSVLSFTFETDFALWFVGHSGAFKSTLAALAASHFGSFDYNSLPAGWSSTVNYLEGLLFKWKDALLVIDNYVPGQTAREHQDLQNKALRLIQNIGDRSSRGRNDRNNEERARRDPRGLVLFTGEDLPPTNESTLGRLLVVDVQKGALDLDKIVSVRSTVHVLPEAMRGFIEFLLKDFSVKTTTAKESRFSLATSFRHALRPFGSHERTANNLATLGAGFTMFLDFAREAGVLKEGEVEMWKQRMMDTFLDLGKSQKVNTEDSKPTERYVSILKTLLLQGRISLAPKEETLDMHTSGTSKAIGWIDDARNEVLLLPDLAWEAVESFVGRDRWPYKQTQLQKQLVEEGTIKKEASDDNKPRLTCRRTAGKKSVRVLVFEKATFDDVLREKKPGVDYAEVGMVLEQSFGPN